MKQLLALLFVASTAWGQNVETRRVGVETRRLDGSSAIPAFTDIPAPTGCASGLVPYFNAALQMVCSPTVYAPTTDTTTSTGTIAARNLTATALATPGAITVTPVLSKTGTITTVAGASLVDGDYFTIKYAPGLTVPIEFDATPANGTTGGRVPLVFAAGDSADTIRDAIVTLLNAAAGTALTASSGGAATVALVLDVPGAVGDTSTENVANAGFAVTGFADPVAATTYTYKLVARIAGGYTTEAGAASTTVAGHLTLSVANRIDLSWAAVPGAVGYDVYRTVGGATLGKIASATTALTLSDTGLAGGGETAPTSNGTGRLASTALAAGGVAIVGAGGRVETDAGLTYDAVTGTLTVGAAIASARVVQSLDGTTRQTGQGTSARVGNALTRADAWTVYDAGVTSGLAAKRFWGAIFDGRYIYYVPGGGSGVAGASGVVLRYDTTMGYSDPTAWVAYDASATGGLNTTGYAGATYDGRYIYMAPDKDTTDTAHGRVLRYDTRASFTASGSWAVYDASGTGSLDCRGYRGALYDGTRYVYFAPFRTSTALGDYHGRVLRYDTRASFTASGSWSVYDAATAHGSGAKGYKGVVSDGRRLYFVPNNNNGVGQYAIVLRYDMTASFSAAGSWDAIDATPVDGLVTKGFSAGVFDGRYVTFVPIGDSSTMHGRVLRYDTRMPFLSLTSWSAYDAGGVGSRGFAGAIFDGRYITYVPYFQGVEGGGGTYSGLMSRYDTEQSFHAAPAWESYDGSAIGGLSTIGYAGAAFDGRYAYLAPYYDGTVVHGRALRFDTGAPALARTAQGSRTIGYRQEIPFDKLLTDNVATTVFEVALAAGDMIGSGGLYSGTIIVTATEGTNVQVGLDAIRWTAGRTPAGAQACAVANVTTGGVALAAPSNSVGTLGSYGWSCDVATAGKVIVSYRVDSSLTAPVVRIRGLITVETLNVVTVL